MLKQTVQSWKLWLQLQRLLGDGKDMLADWLDTLYGSTVTDNSIFTELPQHFEAEYHEDMEALNVSHHEVIEVPKTAPSIDLVHRESASSMYISVV